MKHVLDYTGALLQDRDNLVAQNERQAIEIQELERALYSGETKPNNSSEVAQKGSTEDFKIENYEDRRSSQKNSELDLNYSDQVRANHSDGKYPQSDSRHAGSERCKMKLQEFADFFARCLKLFESSVQDPLKLQDLIDAVVTQIDTFIDLESNLENVEIEKLRSGQESLVGV